MNETKDNFTFDEIDFGMILSDLLSVDTITDLELREGEIWVVDILKGRYRYPLETREKWEREELSSLLEKIPRQLAIRMGVPYNDGNPILDAEAGYRGKGQLRVNAIIGGISGGSYPGIAIRKTTFGLRMEENSVKSRDYAGESFLNLMEVVLRSGCNVMVAGLTGAGKTELLKFLARYIPKSDAIITIEDTYEAYLKRIYPEKEVMSLKATENVGFSQLIRACLRQNPDWIMVSESRGEEVRELMEAVGTGHHLISTIHSDSAANIPWRMVDMAKAMGNEADRMFRQVHQNINIGIYIHYYNDDGGSHRKVTEVCEFYLDANGLPCSHSVYRFDYAKETYVSEPIMSNAILEKIKRSKADTGKIRGEFLS